MMPALSPLQQVARARRIVGENQLRIRWSEESPLSATVTDQQVVVVLSVTRRVDIRGGSKITHRGTRGYVYRRRLSGMGWYLSESFEVINRLPEPELELSFGGVTEAEYRERKAHEDMCYRPGTPSFPMSGPMART